DRPHRCPVFTDGSACFDAGDVDPDAVSARHSREEVHHNPMAGMHSDLTGGDGKYSHRSSLHLRIVVGGVKIWSLIAGVGGRPNRASGAVPVTKMLRARTLLTLARLLP